MKNTLNKYYIRASLLLITACFFVLPELKAQIIVNVCSGENVYLHISSPAISSVQWQSSSDSITFSDVSGATADTLLLSAVQTGAWYRARITGQVCDPYYTEVKHLVVHPLPAVSFSGLQSNYCTTDSVAFFYGTPPNGTFSGPGVGCCNFNPALAGPGTHAITYTVVSAYGCSNSYTDTVTVVAGPLVSFGVLSPYYCITATPVTLNGTPSGGTFTGNGMTANVFTPQTAGAGTHSITYSYTDPTTSCSAALTMSTNVVNTPTTANAGQNINATTLTVQLAANTPVAGTGAWSIVSGTGGSIATPNNPTSNFTGTPNSVYQLVWTISNPPCPSSTDTVQVTMPAGPNLPSVTCGMYTLYVHPTDNGTSIWGCTGFASGATSDDDGAANTATVVQLCTPPTAANICDTLTAYGFSDWYLPAYNELECLRQNAATLGGFSNTTYWSSTEGSGTFYLNAKFRTFPSGTSGVGSKSSTRSVRCVRK